MKVLHYTKYLYLFVAVLSIYKIITTWSNEERIDYMFIIFAVVSLAMFFFRRHYEKKFENYKREKDD
ncbi:hypothetical protein U8527_19845 [Kordia algicida OT-1]|uniref:Uncharacterized protein n=1 Tax=Kordia algicida OT-1 TaxID=391587 RepID=A9DK63_9FLAO|nr:hypothetical protein [Kordia algicida]EDP98263.1 hypothetical protein KAOT1_13637 [Kordia algicida OT-1]